MKNIVKKAIRIIAFLLCAALLFSFLSAVCEQKTFKGAWNYKAKLNEFYSLEENTLDYICVGSSHMYCTINPLEVWNESGIAGFVLATQQQPLLASYHYIREAFKTQSPKYVVLEGFMVWAESTYDPTALYNAIDSLKFSLNKIQMIHNLVEYDRRPEYYFNIAKYHTRWSSITPSEISLLFQEHVDTYKGFVALKGTHSGQNIIPDYQTIRDVPLSEFNTKILNDIYELVTSHDAELIFMLGPYNAELPELCEQVKAEIAWATEKNVTVLDYCAMLDTIGIDPEQDYSDPNHLDVSGATKTSAHFASYLEERGLGENLLIDREKWQADYDFYVAQFPDEVNH